MHDNFSLTETQNPQTLEQDYVLVRHDSKYPQVIVDSFTLNMHEAYTVFTALLHDPKFEEIATNYLVGTNKVKHNSDFLTKPS